MPEPAYSEGDWFAIPLRGGGFATGLIARMMPHREGVLLGYFFGPRRDKVPTLDELRDLSTPDAILT
jgi:Immunity protein 26